MCGERLAVLVHSAGRLLAAAAPNVTAWRGACGPVPALPGCRAGCPPGLHHADLGDDPGVGRCCATGRPSGASSRWPMGLRRLRYCSVAGPRTRDPARRRLRAGGGRAVRLRDGRAVLGLPPSQRRHGRSTILALGLPLEGPDSARAEPDRLGGMAYMTAVPMAACQLCWLAALRRVPPGRRRWRPCSPLWSASRGRSPWVSRSARGRPSRLAARCFSCPSTPGGRRAPAEAIWKCHACFPKNFTYDVDSTEVDCVA